MSSKDTAHTAAASVADREEIAAQIFLRRQLGNWAEFEEDKLKQRLAGDAAFASAFARVEQAWAAVGNRSGAPELMVLREQALARARLALQRKQAPALPAWRRAGVRAAAIAAGVLILLASAYQWAPFGFRPGEYRTAIAEQRVVELEDHSRVALDAVTKLTTRFSADARIVELLEGQAQFSVAHDPRRPFRVQVAGRTIVALGTKFTVEYVDSKFNLAMLEGRVAVIAPEQVVVEPHPDAATVDRAGAAPATTLPVHPSPQVVVAEANNAPPDIIELAAGEALRIDRDGQSTLIEKADLKAANAWREGKVIFNAESLEEAIRRLNRYSRLSMQVTDPGLAAMRVSGVFDAGDTHAFIEAVVSSLPARADYSDPSTIRLRAR